MTQDNDIVVKAWNTVLFDKFCRFKHLLTDGLSAHSDEALARHAHPEGARVLDVGCGFGDSSRSIAKRVGPKGEAVGSTAPRTSSTVRDGMPRRRVSTTLRSSWRMYKATISAGPTTLHFPASARCSSRCPVPPCATFVDRSNPVASLRWLCGAVVKTTPGSMTQSYA